VKGLTPNRSASFGSLSIRSPVRDRRQHLAPIVDDGDADILQVLRRQLRQDLAIDLVLAKRGLVLSEAETSQPPPDALGEGGRHHEGYRAQVAVGDGYLGL